jgi:hypothetical protein
MPDHFDRPSPRPGSLDVSRCDYGIYTQPGARYYIYSAPPHLSTSHYPRAPAPQGHSRAAGRISAPASQLAKPLLLTTLSPVPPPVNHFSSAGRLKSKNIFSASDFGMSIFVIVIVIVLVIFDDDDDDENSAAAGFVA